MICGRKVFILPQEIWRNKHSYRVVQTFLIIHWRQLHFETQHILLTPLTRKITNQTQKKKMTKPTEKPIINEWIVFPTKVPTNSKPLRERGQCLDINNIYISSNHHRMLSLYLIFTFICRSINTVKKNKKTHDRSVLCCLNLIEGRVYEPAKYST